MKKITKLSLLTLVVALVLAFNVSLPVSSAATMTISQFVELLITVGAIPADRVVAARAMAVTLSTATTTTAITPVVVVAPPTDIISTSTAYIQVLKPNGAESWDIGLGLPYTISWGSSGLTKARVALVNSKNALCELTLNPVASKDGDHNFNVLLKTAKCYNLTTGTSTPLTDGTYKVRVYYTDVKNNTVKDESNATFKINPIPVPSMKVTYPNGGETLNRNNDYEVKYSLTNVTDSEDDLIYLYLLDNAGNVAFNSRKTLRGGTYTMELPGNLSAGAYKVKLKLTTKKEHVELIDTSDNFFWISTGL